MKKLAIIREGKIPPDKRVALTPGECKEALYRFKNLKIVVEPSNIRAFTNDEYLSAGIQLNENISDSDMMIGIKEVPVEQLVDGKTYMFFSHTIKKQPHNKKLLKAILSQKITLIDYECLTNKKGERIIAFGRFAGIVGAYNAILTYGKKFKSFDLKRAHECKNQMELEQQLKKVKIPGLKIAITGRGRVANGAMEILNALDLKKVTAEEFLNSKMHETLYTVLEPYQYAKRKDGKSPSLQDYIAHPTDYEPDFMKYARIANLYIACHFWDHKAPVIISASDARASDFNIKVIADISCDIGGPLATTVRASTIEDPIYGYDPASEKETNFMNENAIAVMAVDNLPCELPRDSSEYFGNVLVKNILPCLLEEDPEGVIERATIAKDGKLTPRYDYLSDYVL